MSLELFVQVVLLILVFVMAIFLISLIEKISMLLHDIFGSVKSVEKKVGVDDPRVPVVPKEKLNNIPRECPNCNAEVSVTDKYCVKCGQKFVDDWSKCLKKN